MRFSWSRVLDISGAHFLHDIYGSFLAPLFPLLIQKLGLSYFMVGSLSVIPRIPSLLNPFIGMWIERKDFRIFISVMPAVTVTAMSLIGIASSYWQLVILLLIMGWSSAFFHVTGPLLIKQVSGTKTGMGISIYTLSAELGRSVGPIIIVSAVSWWGLEGTIRIIPIGLLASFLLFLRLRRIEPINNSLEPPTVSHRALLTKLRGFYGYIAAYIFSQGLLKALLVTFLPAYYTSEGESLWFAAYTLSIFELAGAAGSFISGSVSDKIGRGKTLVTISILVPLIMIAFVFTNSWINIGVLLLMGLVIFGSAPVFLALIQEVGVQRPGFSTGVYMTVNFVMGALATLIVGILADIYGLKQIFFISPLFAIITIPFALKIKYLSAKL